MYNSLAGLAFSALGTFSVFPASVAKLKFLVSQPGKLAWALEHSLSALWPANVPLHPEPVVLLLFVNPSVSDWTGKGKERYAMQSNFNEEG